MAGVYNFAKVSGDALLKFLTGIVAIHIPWESGAADCPVLPAEGENLGRPTREELLTGVQLPEKAAEDIISDTTYYRYIYIYKYTYPNVKRQHIHIIHQAARTERR